MHTCGWLTSQSIIPFLDIKTVFMCNRYDTIHKAIYYWNYRQRIIFSVWGIRTMWKNYCSTWSTCLYTAYNPAISTVTAKGLITSIITSMFQNSLWQFFWSMECVRVTNTRTVTGTSMMQDWIRMLHSCYHWNYNVDVQWFSEFVKLTRGNE